MTFSSFKLSEPILRALSEKGYTNPTPIQAEAIPHILAGRDLLGSAQTGTGKTGAFCLPILQKLSITRNSKRIRALILTPTRELAIQVSENFNFYGRHLNIGSAVIFGGVSQAKQVSQIRSGAEVVIATPGRLLDLINQRIVDLRHLEILVLDEADRMLDMGFINDIKKILRIVPTTRQTIFFSATMPADVQKLVSSILKNPVTINIEHQRKEASISQGVFYVPQASKRELLKHIINEQNMRNVLVFTRTKHRADRLARDLAKSGISAEAFHSNKSQFARQKSLSNFKTNRTRVLVATDIAARGIDIINLPYVINYELPDTAETYTHRIGRTGRAGSFGTAFTLCGLEEQQQMRQIRSTTATKLEVMKHPFA